MMESIRNGLLLPVLTDGSDQLLLWQLILVLLLVFSQGLFLFFDGRKHGIRYYWIWAIWGMTTCPVPFVLYWFLVRRKKSRKQPETEV